MAEEEKSMTAAEFLETFPLYRKVKGEDFSSLPTRISLHCDGCGKETTWALNSGQPSIYWAYCQGGYTCVLCGKERVWFYLYRDSKNGLVMKVGQHPEPSITIPKALESGLKDSVQHYRRGLICFNQGYGIAAVAYFRRVVEERTNELIYVVGELARANGSGENEVQRILAAKVEKTYDKRLQVAAQMIPASLRPGNVNPLGRLHDLLSDALHAKNEEGALATAGEMRDIIEHVFRNLKDYIDAQRRYAEKVQRIARAPGSPSSASPAAESPA